MLQNINNNYILATNVLKYKKLIINVCSIDYAPTIACPSCHIFKYNL